MDINMTEQLCKAFITRPFQAWPTIRRRPDRLTPATQRQSTDPAKSITPANAGAAGTPTPPIKMPATVTFYRGHRRTLRCPPGTVSLIIMCIGTIIAQLLSRRQITADVSNGTKQHTTTGIHAFPSCYLWSS